MEAVQHERRHLIDMTSEWHDKVPFAEQSILNMVFRNNWLPCLLTTTMRLPSLV
ncbi:MAG: hypothetical protein ACLS3S_02865 [Streptococcus salivarius]